MQCREKQKLVSEQIIAGFPITTWIFRILIYQDHGIMSRFLGKKTLLNFSETWNYFFFHKRFAISCAVDSIWSLEFIRKLCLNCTWTIAIAYRPLVWNNRLTPGQMYNIYKCFSVFQTQLPYLCVSLLCIMNQAAQN